jgi:ribosome maturation protein Sdo1
MKGFRCECGPAIDCTYPNCKEGGNVMCKDLDLDDVAATSPKAKEELESLRRQLAAEIRRLEIALRIKTEEHKCCSEDLMKLRESEQSGWKEAAIAWEVCGSIHEAFAKKKDALYSTRHSDFERHAEDARRMLSTESKEKVE